MSIEERMSKIERDQRMAATFIKAIVITIATLFGSYMAKGDVLETRTKTAKCHVIWVGIPIEAVNINCGK